MSIYRNKRERSTSKLCYIREKSRERTVATSLTTLSTARRSLRTRHLYTTNMLIFWAPSFVLSAGVPQFSIYESAIVATAFPLRELAAATVVASFLFPGSNQCASHFSLDDDDIQLSIQEFEMLYFIYRPLFLKYSDNLWNLNSYRISNFRTWKTDKLKMQLYNFQNWLMLICVLCNLDV